MIEKKIKQNSRNENITEEVITISKEVKLCNGCKKELPEILDRGICLFCGVRN